MDYTQKESIVISQSLQDLLDKFSSQEMVLKYFKLALQDWIDNELDPKTQDNLGGRYLKRRTGALAQSVRWKLRKYGLGFKLTAESGVPYGTIQEHGGTIVPIRAKYLTIPLPAALTSAGVLRKPAREWSNTFVQRSSSGNLIIFQNRGNKIIPLFILKKKVKIKPTHWASQSVTATEGLIPQYVKRRFPI